MATDNSTFGNTELYNLYTDIQILNKSGATSETYKVKLYGKWHFLKRLKNEYKSNPIYIAALNKEFDLGFQLDHPNIIRYIKKEVDNEGLYIVTEYIEGENLQEFLLKHSSRIKDRNFMNKIIHEILSVLEYIHNNQIIHLDLKPENILITNIGNNIKLIDLGFSSSGSYDKIMCGTPTYSSPEQFENPALINVTSDIYSFGKILIFLFTLDASLENISHLPSPYRIIAKKCTENKPENRYCSIRDINKVVEKYRLKRKVIFISTFVALVLFILSTTVYIILSSSVKTNFYYDKTSHIGNSSYMPANVGVNLHQQLLDSLFKEFDKRYPKLEFSNIFEAKEEYDSILSQLSIWVDSHINSIEETQRFDFLNGITNITDKKLEKYYILQANPIFNHPREYYKDKIGNKLTSQKTDSFTTNR